LYILDSDIFDILVYPSPSRSRVEAKIASVGKDNVWFSVITAWEKLNGLNREIGRLLNPRDPKEALRQTLEFETLKTLIAKLCDSQLVSFTDEDYEVYKQIFREVNKAQLDCRIAASAKRRDWTVITHNSSDFDVIRRKAGVKVDDWSIIPPT
jgi:predicted nucleic acid-binding protein